MSGDKDTGYRVGALPPYSVTHIDPAVCGGERDRWHVMGTVGGDPRDPCGPVAICEWEPSAHTIAALLNATHGHSRLPVRVPWWRRLFGVTGRAAVDVVVPQQRDGGAS